MFRFVWCFCVGYVRNRMAMKCDYIWYNFRSSFPISCRLNTFAASNVFGFYSKWNVNCLCFCVVFFCWFLYMLISVAMCVCVYVCAREFRLNIVRIMHRSKYGLSELDSLLCQSFHRLFCYCCCYRFIFY